MKEEKDVVKCENCGNTDVDMMTLKGIDVETNRGIYNCKCNTGCIGTKVFPKTEPIVPTKIEKTRQELLTINPINELVNMVESLESRVKLLEESI